MNKSRIIVLAIALVFSIGAAMMANKYLAAKNHPQVRTVVQDKVERVDVLVMAQDVKMGQKIPPAALKWVKWPKKLLASGMITRTSAPNAMSRYANSRARAPLFTDEPLYPRKVFVAGKGGFLSALLPKGMRAIAVRVSVETGAGGFIMPNDRVDVLLTRKSHGRTITDTVLSNVRILAIDQSYRAGEDGKEVADSSIKTATLELEPMQSEALARAETMGQLTLALRSMADMGEAALGDDGPRLSPKFARKNGGEVRILRYGIPRNQARN